MKIFPSSKKQDFDKQLLHADTCFFNVSVPAYTTKEILKDKLLISITQGTATMDADTTQGPNMQQWF
jgi:hypothetical protein